ncbi:hypothetical protein QT986_27455 [Microcoleus sp. herbarium14]
MAKQKVNPNLAGFDLETLRTPSMKHYLESLGIDQDKPSDESISNTVESQNTSSDIDSSNENTSEDKTDSEQQSEKIEQDKKRSKIKADLKNKKSPIEGDENSIKDSSTGNTSKKYIKFFLSRETENLIDVVKLSLRGTNKRLTHSELINYIVAEYKKTAEYQKVRDEVLKQL